MTRLAAPESRLQKLPSRALPILYFAWAHLCLIAAAAILALAPDRFAAFFYQTSTMAIVHLVTLGWITSSILGSIYIVCPLALRLPLPAGGGDFAAFGLVAAGTLAVASHFWVGRFGGVGWGGAALLLGAGWVAARLWRALPAAPIERSIKAHIALAPFNLLLAGAFGAQLAFDKVQGMMGGSPMPNLFAHVHLAAIGWGAMMVAGVGYRLLPMTLPAAMPRGIWLWASALLLEAGTLGVFFTLLTQSRWLSLFAILAAAGVAVLAGHVVWMQRHRRPAPTGLPCPDFGTLGALQALTYLLLSAGLGLALALWPISDFTLAPAAVYGVLGLLGFLSQMVAGIEARLLPLFAATHAIARSGGAAPVSPHGMSSPWMNGAIFGLWTAAVPLLAGGFGLESPRLLAAGAWLLLAAAILGMARAARVVRHAFSA